LSDLGDFFPQFQPFQADGFTMSQQTPNGVSRRAFLRGSGAAAAASTVVSSTLAQDAAPGSQVITAATSITLKVNGKSMSASVEPRTTLLDMLRYQFDLTGAKPVSADGTSGASTVLVDGKPVMASTTLALSVAGKEVTTSESMMDHAVVHAFVDNDAQQCGFCTPGFVVAVRAFLDKHPDATEEQIRAGLNGNICRCGTYANILQAVISLVKGNQNG
jgi:xanthine dehydrogenase YagT iron-sulfur-binding subunit